MVECLWCGETTAQDTEKDCYWVMPDGRRSVQILQVPALGCPSCGSYLSDAINQKVEEQLYMCDLSAYADVFSYEELLKAPVKSLWGNIR